jgi:hypothetical protein
MNTYLPLHWMGGAFYLMAMATATAQVATPSQSFSSVTPAVPTVQASSAQTTLQLFQSEQQALAQSFNALLTLNPSPDQLQAWQQHNATALANQQQLALNLAADSALEPQPPVGPPNIPAGASSTMTAFQTTQAALASARAQIHNQLLNTLPAGVTDAQISQMQQSEEQLFQQQQGANLQLQSQRAQTLAAESASQPTPLPPPLVVPAGVSASMAAFLTARDQLMRDQITLTNQYVTATAAVRDAALQQWMQQNAGRFQQMQQLAQNLSPVSSN